MTDSYLKRLVSSFESRTDRVAMRIVGDDRQVYTFGETLARIRSVAYRIRQENIEFGDRVAVVGENHPAWAVAYLATLYSGTVCVPIDPHGEIETVTNFLENSEAKLAFIDSGQVARFGQIEERLGRHIPAVVWGNGSPPVHGDAEDIKNGSDVNGRAIALTTEQDTETTRDPDLAKSLSPSPASQRLGGPNGFENFDDWASTDYPDSFSGEIPNAAGDDVALLIYTSGTTGTPKGVPLTHGNIVAELDGINEILEISDRERILSLLPLFHAYLQIVNLWVATTYGCEVGYLKELSPAELGNAMKEFKPTILTTVPRLWYLFHKKIFDAVETKPRAVRALFRTMLAANGLLRETVGINLGRVMFGKVHGSFGGELRMAISAGSRFDEAVARDFHKLGFTILQGYGLTETSGAATATYETDNRVGSVGKPLKGAEVKIDSPDKDGVGEVLIRGGMVFGGYYRNREATAEAFTGDGWFRSGDLGKFDKDGHLYIVGRAKDVIVLPSGKNVHPEDLEVHYLKAPEVEELAIIGVADKSEARAGAEKLVAVAIPNFDYLKQAKLPNSKEAIRYALDNLGRELPEYQRVREYIVRAEPLPRTATRKIKRFVLKKEIEGGLLTNGLPERKTWEPTADDKAYLGSGVAKVVLGAINAHAKEPSKDVHPQMNLEIDLGLDSLARAEVFAALEQTFETEFTAEQAAAALTVADLTELVKTTPLGKQLDTGNGPEDQALTADLNWSKIVREAEGISEIESVIKQRPVFEMFSFVVMKTFGLFCKVFMRLEISGIENLRAVSGRNASVNERAALPKDDTLPNGRVLTRNGEAPNAFLICPNHQSFLDPFVLCSTYPWPIFRNFFHVGAKMFFEGPIMGIVAKMLRVVPIDQDTQLMRAMKAGAIGLKAGKILNIYPEGERAFDGNLHNFKKGAAILATELDLPILPVALDGLQNVWARKTRRIRPAKVKIRFGEPIYPNDTIRQAQITAGQPNGTSGDTRYELITDQLRSDIEKMIQELRK